MLSKGGKIEYLCPNCRSSKVLQCIRMYQKSGECLNCDTWWPWHMRIKVSLKKKKELQDGHNH